MRLFNKKNKQGQLALAFASFIVITLLIMLFAVISPIGTSFTIGAYTSGEAILDQSIQQASLISDASVRTAINDSLYVAKTSTTDSVDVFTGLYRYGWIIALILVGIIYFIFARRQVEYSYVV